MDILISSPICQDGLNAQAVTRVLVACLLMAWTLWVVKVDDHDPQEINRRFLLVTAALFLLSPTQFPWYSLWMLPFLALHPKFSLLALSALLPLYYFRTYLEARALVKVYDHGVVWLEYAPVWYLLIREWSRGCKKRILKTENLS